MDHFLCSSINLPVNAIDDASNAGEIFRQKLVKNQAV